MALSDLNISKLKQKMDVSNLTLRVHGETVYKEGRFYLLWRDGNFIIIQAEPWCRPGHTDVPSPSDQNLEENRALCYLEEVLQTMLDTIVFDSENNWAYLVRLRDNTYRLEYARRQLVHDCVIWTKVVELDDIEVTRFTSGLFWEGIYEGEDVDLFIAWQDLWGKYVSAESRGQKLVESMGIGHHFFRLKTHVSKNGVIIGIMLEALIGRCVTPADRAAVFEAISDIQRHGIYFSFAISDIYITERGVRFASASSAKYFRDRDVLAKKSDIIWKRLAKMFDYMDDDDQKGRPITLTREEAKIRWIWSIVLSDEFCRLQGRPFTELRRLSCPSEPSATRRDKRPLLPPADFSGDHEASDERNETMDKPLVVRRGARRHPYAYARLRPKRLLLPQESDLVTIQ